MCRLAGYVGPPVALSSLLYDAPHSLEVQAYAPREMLTGHTNVDGTGVAWWPEGEGGGGAEPLRYVSERPPWSDPNLPGLSRRLSAAAVLAAVRNGTPGVPYGAEVVAPFVGGGLAFVHNGVVGRFRQETGRALASRLPDHLYARMDAVSDSLLVFLTVLRHREAHPEQGVAGALRTTVCEVAEVCAAAGAEATLNLVVADGERLVAVRASHAVEGNNPLVVAQSPERWPGGTVLASEALDDDPAWAAVPDNHLVEVTAEGVTMAPVVIGTSAA